MTQATVSRTVALPRESAAVSLARRVVAEHDGGLLDGHAETARLLVSELVTNAVRHGVGSIALTIDIDPVRARFEVRDDGRGRPAQREHPGAHGGFGLNLVDTMASRWGVEEGGCVWFELDVAPSPPPAAEPAPAAPAASPAPPASPAAAERPRRRPLSPAPGLAAVGAREAVRSALAPRRWSAWVLAGAAVALGLTALDAIFSSIAILTAGLVLAPLTCTLLGRWADTAAVAGLALALAALSAVWYEGPASAYVVAVTLVALGGALAVLVALLRAASVVNLARFELLSAVADVGNRADDLGEAIDRLLEVLTPVFADISVIDSTIDGSEHALGARASGPDAERVEQVILNRRPAGPEAPVGSRRTIAQGESQLVSRFTDEMLAAIAHDEEDLALLRSIHLRSALFVPLKARGHTIGSLSMSLGPSGRAYSRQDLAFAEVFGGRAAVVLDNAGLTQELSAAERQLDAALHGLAEAVTVTDRQGRIVYANEAAVALLRVGSAEELYDAEPGEIMERFGVYDEEGRPVDRLQLPGVRLLMGEEDPSPLLVRNVVRATGEERWMLNKATCIVEPDGTVERVVNVIEDVTETKQAELAQRMLAEASDALSSSLDYEDTLQRVAEVAVPRLADWCGVDLPGGRLVRPVAVAHVDPEKVALAHRLRERYPVARTAQSGIAAVIRGEVPSVVMSDIPDDALVAYAQDEEHLEMLRAVGMASLIVVPLTAGGRTLGALTLARSDPVRKFSEADLELAEELGRRAGTAVLNARLFTERSAIAQTLQRGLRPPELREIPGFAAASLYRAAGELNEVGGDFYDAFPTAEGWMVLVGDVAGQGAEAATLTGLARYTLRSVGQLTGDPVLAIRQLNATLRDQPEMSLCTAVCAHVRIGDDGRATMTLANCGHPRPLLLRDGAASEIGELLPGDTLVLYTDGVLDTVGADARFGDERLAATLLAGPTEPRALVAHLAATLDAFQRGSQRDDTAVLALQFTGPPQT